MDQATRVADLEANPAALMAASWACRRRRKRASRDMVVPPFSRQGLRCSGRYLRNW